MHTLSAMASVVRLPYLRPALACVLFFVVGAAQAQPAPTGLLNDTGQTQCANASDELVACDSATAGNAGTRPGQDGRFGRDAASPAKAGGGAAGFDFTKICFNGDAQGAGTCTGALVANTTGTATGSTSTDWACTRDNVTNRMWSLQTQTATWDAATAATYPNAGHNSATRCGFSSGWRLPTRFELVGIVHNGLTTGPMIDANYFPATQSDLYYWTSDTFAPSPSFAWIVFFNYGNTDANYKTDTGCGCRWEAQSQRCLQGRGEKTSPVAASLQAPSGGTPAAPAPSSRCYCATFARQRVRLSA